MTRAEQVGVFYADNAQRLRRSVAHDLRAPAAVIEDACQTAWTVLLRRDDIPLDKHAFAWLGKVARTAGYRQATGRDLPAGAFLPAGALDDPRELPEPAWELADPLARTIDRERYNEQREQLRALTDRERRFLALQALGLSHAEIAQRENATLRTVERQLCRARRKLRAGW